MARRLLLIDVPYDPRRESLPNSWDWPALLGVTEPVHVIDAESPEFLADLLDHAVTELEHKRDDLPEKTAEAYRAATARLEAARELLDFAAGLPTQR